MPDNPDATASAQPQKLLRCAKCGHRNSESASVCASCGAHLYIVCHACGHRNLRARSRCSECRQRLHRSWFARLSRTKSKFPILQIVLLLIAIVFGYAAVVYFSEMHIPEPEGFWRAPAGSFQFG